MKPHCYLIPRSLSHLSSVNTMPDIYSTASILPPRSRPSTNSLSLPRPSQAVTVPVRNIDAVGVSHSVPAFPEIPSPSGFEKQSKLGSILPVATSLGDLSFVSMDVSNKISQLRLTFRMPKSPLMKALFHPICIGMPN